MTLSRFHVPREYGRAPSYNVTVGPPDASIRLSFRSATKASCRPSSDQKGLVAPSVPARGCASVASSGRTHTRPRPSAPGATKARRVPSRVSASPRANLGMAVLASDTAFGLPVGGRIRLRYARAEPGVCVTGRPISTARIAERTANAPTSVQGSQTVRGALGTVSLSPVCASRISRRASAISCRRPRRSLLRHRRNSLVMADGVAAGKALQSGSLLKTLASCLC